MSEGVSVSVREQVIGIHTEGYVRCFWNEASGLPHGISKVKGSVVHINAEDCRGSQMSDTEVAARKRQLTA